MRIQCVCGYESMRSQLPEICINRAMKLVTGHHSAASRPRGTGLASAASPSCKSPIPVQDGAIGDQDAFQGAFIMVWDAEHVQLVSNILVLYNDALCPAGGESWSPVGVVLMVREEGSTRRVCRCPRAREVALRQDCGRSHSQSRRLREVTLASMLRVDAVSYSSLAFFAVLAPSTA